MDEKSYKSIIICHFGYVTVKEPSYVNSNGVNPFYLIINKINCTLKEVMEISI